MRKGFFARLAVVNIRKNKQIYVPYILACLFNVAMLYMMLFINHNAGMKTIRHSGDELALLLFSPLFSCCTATVSS